MEEKSIIETISTNEGITVLAVAGGLLLWLLLLAYQSYRSGQLARDKLVRLVVVTTCGVLAVAGLFVRYAMPTRAAPEPTAPPPATPARPLSPPPASDPQSPSDPALETAKRVPRGYVCYRAVTPPTLDGSLRDAAWQDAPWTEEFVDIRGDSEVAPGESTRAKLLWNHDGLYVGASLQEAHIWATQTEPGSPVFQDNDFEVFIDPNGDNHAYFELELNALNTRRVQTLDKPHKDGGVATPLANTNGLASAVHLVGTANQPGDSDGGWSVELFLPWSCLAGLDAPTLPPEPGDQWRINLSRVEWRHLVVGEHYRKVPGTPEENWVWSPQGTMNIHRPETWGVVQFSVHPPGTDRYLPPPALPLRRYLMELYYAQQAHRSRNGEWARALTDLRTTPPRLPAGVTLEGLGFSEDGGFTATATLKQPGTPPIRMRVDHTSRLWELPAAEPAP